MGLNKRKEILATAVFYRNVGDSSTKEWQMDRLTEECSELIQAVMKVKRYPGDKDRLQNLYEELSHVNICINIVLGLLENKDAYRDEMDKKLTQLEKSYAKELSTIENLKYQG